MTIHRAGPVSTVTKMTIHRAGPVYSHFSIDEHRAGPVSRLSKMTIHRAGPVYSLVLLVICYLLLDDIHVDGRRSSSFNCPICCLNVITVSASTTCAGSLFHSVTTLLLKKFFRTSRRDRCFCNLYWWPREYCNGNHPVERSTQSQHSLSQTPSQ